MGKVTQADVDLAQAIISGCRGYGVTIRPEHSAARAIADYRTNNHAELVEALRLIADDPYQHGQRIQKMKAIARKALSLYGGEKP